MTVNIHTLTDAEISTKRSEMRKALGIIDEEMDRRATMAATPARAHRLDNLDSEGR